MQENLGCRGELMPSRRPADEGSHFHLVCQTAKPITDGGYFLRRPTQLGRHLLQSATGLARMNAMGYLVGQLTRGCAEASVHDIHSLSKNVQGATTREIAFGGRRIRQNRVRHACTTQPVEPFIVVNPTVDQREDDVARGFAIAAPPPAEVHRIPPSWPLPPMLVQQVGLKILPPSSERVGVYQ
ncbi:MAG: hypothetical protein DMF77_12730 [Acidobacteria bacterium]|nr:MAG: hypothetical protein DMF77_12730 [Acidobacteriota bacterium]